MGIQSLSVDQASLLGVDFGDLEEYGFEVNSENCPGKACITKDSFKNLDDAFKKSAKFSNKVLEEGAELYRRAQCHPDIRKNI